MKKPSVCPSNLWSSISISSSDLNTQIYTHIYNFQPWFPLVYVLEISQFYTSKTELIFPRKPILTEGKSHPSRWLAKTVLCASHTMCILPQTPVCSVKLESIPTDSTPSSPKPIASLRLVRRSSSLLTNLSALSFLFYSLFSTSNLKWPKIVSQILPCSPLLKTLAGSWFHSELKPESLRWPRNLHLTRPITFLPPVLPFLHLAHNIYQPKLPCFSEQSRHISEFQPVCSFPVTVFLHPITPTSSWVSSLSRCHFYSWGPRWIFHTKSQPTLTHITFLCILLYFFFFYITHFLLT